MRTNTARLAPLLIFGLLGVAACSDSVEEQDPWDLDEAQEGTGDATNNGQQTNNNGQGTDEGDSTKPDPYTDPEPGELPSYPSLPPEPPRGDRNEGAEAPPCTVTYRSDQRWEKTKTTFGPHGPTEVVGINHDGSTETPTIWTYDDEGRLVERTRGTEDAPDSSRETWTYEAGHVVRHTWTRIDENGVATTWTTERLIESNVPIRDTHFENGEETGSTYYVYRDGARIREEYYEDPATADHWDARFTFDDAGRLLSEERTNPAYGGSVEHPAGYRASYDDMGRLSEISSLRRPGDYKRFTWTHDKVTRVEQLYTLDEDNYVLLRLDVEWDPDTGALRHQEGWQDGQSLITWSYEGEGCRKSAWELSRDAVLLMPGSAGR